MADRFYIQYAASATPIEQLGATDSTQNVRMVHSSIDKTIGGGIEIDCGATATGVGYKEYTTTTSSIVTLDQITGLTLTDIDFLIVKIKEAVDADGVCNCFVQTGSVTVSKLKEVGDSCMIRPDALEGNVIKINSSSGKLCKIDIMWGLEA